MRRVETVVRCPEPWTMRIEGFTSIRDTLIIISIGINANPWFFFYKKSRYPVYHELFVRMQIPLCSSVCWRWLRPKGEDRQEKWKPFEPCWNARSVQELRDYVNFSREKCKWTSTLKSIRFYLHDLVFKSGVYIIINKITKPECFLNFFRAIKCIS